MLIAYDIDGAAMIGTSRGGLATMLLAAAQPTLIGAAVLNDIGPVIELAGLKRIAGYVGRTTVPTTWADAAAAVERIDGPFFPAVPDDTWEAIARQRFNEADGRPAAGYDPKLAATLTLPEDGNVPTLWPQFEALTGVPVMVIRGETSDLLSTATVAEMQARHPGLETVTVPGQGHAPLLDDAPTLAAISAFLARADASAHPATG
jgi:pimeloyl-ACP methyl ester carboxylesterase